MPLAHTHTQRFRERINGRDYAIEVSPAVGGQWRASLVRTAGVPMALMPFYGTTPEEACSRLTGWLAAAHAVAADAGEKKSTAPGPAALRTR